MEKSTAEKFKRENRPVWVLGIWSAMPVKARIVKICGDGSAGEYAKVAFIRDGESEASGSEDVCIGDMYESKEDMIRAMYETVHQKTAEIKASVQTKEDCIRFLFQHNVSGAEEPDWTARRAIQEIARERWGMDLG